MSRMIDADVLMEILTTAIRNMKGMAKFLGAEDDHEIQMEIKAYTDIANGVKEMPTIEPERKVGKWITSDDVYETGICSCCRYDTQEPVSYVITNFEYCPNCGADMRGEGEK